MKHNVYSIYDTASALYSRPFFSQSDGEAIRSFSDISQDAEHPIGKHPECYTLLRIGIFDDANAKLTDELNSSLLTGLEAIAQNKNPNNLDMFDQTLAPKSIDPKDYDDGDRAMLKEYKTQRPKCNGEPE